MRSVLVGLGDALVGTPADVLADESDDVLDDDCVVPADRVGDSSGVCMCLLLFNDVHESDVVGRLR